MRWFKHMTASADDEKLARLRDRFGLEGYGFWWSVVEIIAASLDESEQTSVTFSAKKWGNSLGISPKKFRIMAEFCANTGLFSIKSDSEYITIDMPNLLKFKDEYTDRKGKKSGECRDKLRSSRARVKETDTDTDTELNIPPLPPRGEKEGGSRNHAADTKERPKDEPDMEFLELRRFWDEQMRCEGLYAGFREYKTLKKARDQTGMSCWPGLAIISNDVKKRKNAHIWTPGFEIGLGRYLAERTWLAPVVPRASPPAAAPGEKQSEGDRAAGKTWENYKKLQAMGIVL